MQYRLAKDVRLPARLSAGCKTIKNNLLTVVAKPSSGHFESIALIHHFIPPGEKKTALRVNNILIAIEERIRHSSWPPGKHVFIDQF